LETNVTSIYGVLVGVGAVTLAAVARQVTLRGILI
jgi:Flp pilus assembly pilin Flp